MRKLSKLQSTRSITCSVGSAHHARLLLHIIRLTRYCLPGEAQKQTSKQINDITKQKQGMKHGRNNNKYIINSDAVVAVTSDPTLTLYSSEWPTMQLDEDRSLIFIDSEICHELVSGGKVVPSSKIREHVTLNF